MDNTELTLANLILQVISVCANIYVIKFIKDTFDINQSLYRILWIDSITIRGGTGLRFSSSGGLGLCLFELGSGSGLGSILKFKLGRARALHFRARVGLGPRPKYVKKLWISSFKT